MTRSALLSILLALALAVGIGVAVVRDAGGPVPGEKQDCPPGGYKTQSGKPLVPVALVPDRETQVVNFGGGSGWQAADVVLKATPRLPSAVQADQIVLSVPRRLTRVSDNLPTAAIRKPLFTRPYINQTRDRITFTVCIDGEKLKAGVYQGTVAIEGPEGFGPTAVTLTINRRNAFAFWLSLGIAIVLVSGLMLLRGASEKKTVAVGEATKGAAEATGGSQADLERAATKAGEIAARPVATKTRLWEPLTDPGWWLTSLLSLGLAVGAAYSIYAANPAWGADPVGSMFSTVGTCFAAAGFQSLITSLREK